MGWRGWPVAGSLLLSGYTAYGDVLFHPTGLSRAVQRGTLLSGALSMLDTEYEGDLNRHDDIERSVLSLGIIHSISQKTNFIGHLGYTFDVDYDNYIDGMGFQIGGGIDSIVYERGPHGFHIAGLLSYLREDLEVDLTDTEVDVNLVEGHLLATYTFDINQTVDVFAGLEIIPLSQGEIEFANGTDLDLEREDRVNIRGGGSFDLSGVLLQLEMVAAGESSFNLVVAKPL